LDDQWVADLVEVQPLAKYNRGIRYLLMVLDVLSKYAWVQLLKAKTGVALVHAFDKILKQGRQPNRLQTDRGTEFYNRTFQRWLKDQGIQHFSTEGDAKASVVERFNRTLKERLYRYFTAANTLRFDDVLPDLVQGYNATRHRSIGMAPQDVTWENEDAVWKRLYDPRLKGKRPQPKFRVGVRVRLNKIHRTFEKGYVPGWTEEVFVVHCVVPGPVPTYKIREWDDTPVEGTFYEADLQKVHVSDQVLFRIEKVLKRQKDRWWVKWKGWPDKYNSWIARGDVTSLRQPRKRKRQVRKRQDEKHNSNSWFASGETMTLVPSSSFYVTLMSHASTREFPQNRAHHFRNRLPKPIRFVGRGWHVGMVSLSLPTIPRVGEQFVTDPDPLLYVRWHEHVYAKDDQGDDVWWHRRRELKLFGQDMKDSLSSSTESQFFHQLVYRYEQERAKQTQPKNKWAENDGLKLYPTFEWSSQGDLLLNTVNVHSQRQVARVLWGQTLALKMGWIEEVSTGKYRLGPNILQEFHSDTIPTPTDVPGADNKPTFWKVDGTYLVLSVTCNWRFVNLTEKFRPSAEFAPTRPLHVYCDVGTSSMVGNRITDLFREIKYHPQNTTHFEPRHIQYLPCAMKWWKSWKPRWPKPMGIWCNLAKGIPS